MMKPERDAFGEELRKGMAGTDTMGIVERDDGYIDYVQSHPLYFSEFGDWPAPEREAISFATGRVLDVGCGAGRVPLYLQEQDVEVIGIDNSPGAIAVCKKRGVRDARLMPFAGVNRTLPTIDSIVMFGNNFGLFANPRRARWLLRRLKSLTSLQATIIAETTDPYGTENPAHIAYHKKNQARGRLAGELRIRVRHKQFIGEWFDYLMVSKSELEQILDGTGWRVADYIDYSTGSSYIALIRKTEWKEDNTGRV